MTNDFDSRQSRRQRNECCKKIALFNERNDLSSNDVGLEKATCARIASMQDAIIDLYTLVLDMFGRPRSSRSNLDLLRPEKGLFECLSVKRIYRGVRRYGGRRL